MKAMKMEQCCKNNQITAICSGTCSSIKDFAPIPIGSTKDPGGIASLADNIRDIGPIPVKPEHELIFGWRRIDAVLVEVPFK